MKNEALSKKPAEMLEARAGSISSVSEPKVRAQIQQIRDPGLEIIVPRSSAVESASGLGKRQRNVLRRKASSADQHAQYAGTESTASSYEPAGRYESASNPGTFKDPFARSVLGVALPTVSSSTSYLPNTPHSEQATSNSRMASYNPRSASQSLSSQNYPPPSISFAHSSGSSTRRSESPGSFSRTSTPTSMSSRSPSIPSPAKPLARTRQANLTTSRPPVTRRRIGFREENAGSSRSQGLPPLRESGTSSSSSSTVRGPERVEGAQVHEGARRLSPPPPSPPLRQSSKKALQASRDDHHWPSQSPGSSTTTNLSEQHVLGDSQKDMSESFQSSRLKIPPPRPSREGTAKLDDNISPSPVIRSNLSRLITTGHKRRESLEKSPSYHKIETNVKLAPVAGSSPSRASSVSTKPSRLPSPNPIPVRSDSTKISRRQDLPRLEATMTNARVKEPSPSSATSSKSLSRFGIFSKRTKSPLDITLAEGNERSTKKGPAAGTGHEGYGKYARRGRSGSVSTTASRARSTSTGGTSNSITRTPISRKSSITSPGEPEMDSFLLERLAPVVINGGGGVSDRGRNSVECSRNPPGEGSVGRLSHEYQEPGSGSDLVAPTRPSAPTPVPALGENRYLQGGSKSPVDQKDLPEAMDDTQSLASIDASKKPTLAARRSLHRSQPFSELEPIKIPTPINTSNLAPAAPLNSYETMLSAALQTDSTPILTDDISEGREGNWFKAKKTERRARSPRKWNFFQRANVAAKEEINTDFVKEHGDVKEVSVTVARLPESRSVAHYAMLDSFDQEDSDTFNKSMPDPHSSTSMHSSTIVPDSKIVKTDVYKQDYKHSVLLPSPPSLPTDFVMNRRPSSPVVILHRPDTKAEPALTSVTIPEIKGEGETFLQAPQKPRVPRLQQVGRIPQVVSKRDRPYKPTPGSFSQPLRRSPALATSAMNKHGSENAAHPVLSLNTEIAPPNPLDDSTSAKASSAPVASQSHFSPVAKEEFLSFPPRKGSAVSGSSSSDIPTGPGTVAIASQPNMLSGEDEVWNEYDELLDIVELPGSVMRYSSAGRGARSRVSGLASSPPLLRKDSTATGHANVPSKSSFLASRTNAPTTALPSPPKRKSNRPSPLHSADLVPTPLSISDFFAGYGDRNRSSTGSKRQSGSSKRRHSSKSMISETKSLSSEDNGNRKRNTELMAQKTDVASGAQSNLRFSALMTSRWLSFGRVLFSPAHMEVQSKRQDRVLVLDGLGNDDWSFYCALTYPDAMVYNLSPFQDSDDTSSKKQEISGYELPSNHRQIQHTDVAHPFPFPKGFFTAAVFRFPVASSDTAWYNAISECKRVLQPGGYLEISILDLDLVNMGNRARRAVRQLKVKIQAADPNISLKPASDNIQKMLGQRGFENLNRCMVNVPIAGCISDSRAGSFDERNMSLGDMLHDSSHQGDASITKMVAKVGRWWYSRCYEDPVVQDEEDSIWADKALLRECEKRETGLKLLICYAQKPLISKRRTVSM